MFLIMKPTSRTSEATDELPQSAAPFPIGIHIYIPQEAIGTPSWSHSLVIKN
jgi:hypothetical protein